MNKFRRLRLNHFDILRKMSQIYKSSSNELQVQALMLAKLNGNALSVL